MFPSQWYFLNISMSFNLWNFAFNELCDLKNLKKLISGLCPTPITQSYIIYIYINVRLNYWALDTQFIKWKISHIKWHQNILKKYHWEANIIFYNLFFYCKSKFTWHICISRASMYHMSKKSFSLPNLAKKC